MEKNNLCSSLNIPSRVRVDLIVFCDGGALGNPGAGGVGIVIKEQGTLNNFSTHSANSGQSGSECTGQVRNKEQVLERIGKFVGLNVTNNQAEYLAVIEGFKAVRKYKPKKIGFFLDSQLVVRQINGIYKVKNVKLKKFWQKVQELKQEFGDVNFAYVPREENKEADGLVREVLKRAMTNF